MLKFIKMKYHDAYASIIGHPLGGDPGQIQR